MLRTFETDEELYQKFKEMCVREGIKVGKKITKMMEEEVKTHGDGNPVHSLDLWQEKGFKAFPAFMRTRETWQEYIEKFASPKEIKEIMNQAATIHSLADKKIEYGTTNIIKY